LGHLIVFLIAVVVPVIVFRGVFDMHPFEG